MFGSYRRIPIWELRRRVGLLRRFSDLVVKYYDVVEYEQFGGGQPIDNEESSAIRQQINLIHHDAARAVGQAYVNVTVQWTPPPMIGGYVQNVNLIDNVFNLHHFHIPVGVLLDHVTRAIGKYEAEDLQSRIRTLNPFFWLGLAFDAIVGAPFSLARRFGFDTAAAEQSRVGRLAKMIGWLISAAATSIALLQAFGWWDPLLEMLERTKAATPPIP